MEETKRDKFLRIAEMRLNSVNECFRKLGTLTNTNNYDYTKEDVEKVYDEINSMILGLKEKFNDGLFKISKRVERQKNKESDDNEQESNESEKDTIVPKSEPKQETEKEKVDRLKKELSKDDDGCPNCGKPTDIIYECPECLREGCDSCMPAGSNTTCPECEEKKDTGEKNE